MKELWPFENSPDTQSTPVIRKYISELLHDSNDDQSADDNEAVAAVDDDENTGDDASDLEPEPTVPIACTTKKVAALNVS